MALLLVYSC